MISGIVCNECGCKKPDCNCDRHKHYFEATFAPFYYTGKVRKSIHDFKFYSKRWLARPFGHFMAETARQRFDIGNIDIVTCVPITESQTQKRGYNQSELIARRVAKELELPFNGALLTKLYDIKPQREMDAIHRSGNVMGVFDVTKSEAVKGKTILLCDDIKTTSATLDECAKMLMLNGVESVCCLCAAIVKQTKQRR